ncbi:MAG TPA: type II secretion system protein [Prolixibacteraceae bacterium]|nr:type II secretion system protein [Prolixibacteraceae bacterium]
MKQRMFILMQIKRLKTKAFTLLEITIALILSFFILGILYLSYNMMGRQFQNEYQKQLSNLVLFKSQMEMEFFLADSIITTEEDQINSYTNGKQSSYHFPKDAILKTNNLLTDSLYKGEYHTEFLTIGKNNYVKQLTFIFKIDNDEIRLSFKKYYSKNQKLNNKEIRFEY